MAIGAQIQAPPGHTWRYNCVHTCTQTSAGAWKALISIELDGLCLTPPTLALPTPPGFGDGESALRLTPPTVGTPPTPEGIQYAG